MLHVYKNKGLSSIVPEHFYERLMEKGTKSKSIYGQTRMVYIIPKNTFASMLSSYQLISGAPKYSRIRPWE